MAIHNKPAAVKMDFGSVKLDFNTYGGTPIREDVLLMNAPDSAEQKTILKQWELLQYLRRNLKTLDNYISNNKGETFLTFLESSRTATNPKGYSMHKNAVEKIGGHNNDTGGISAYFLNLQNFYDQEETKYDEMEAKSKIPSELVNVISDMRLSREKKRKERKEFRKIKTKNLKQDGKGYLLITVEEPSEKPDEKQLNADAQPNQEEDKKKVAGEIVSKTRKNVGILIAGSLILVAAIYVMTSSGEKTSTSALV